ncbi:MAG: sigma-70 family RNA polymerase sigma factor [Planctomycetes bacterium]|nr:sigma-70 family RNA polymerase sigma factor [Planctomycetota bacterium]
MDHSEDPDSAFSTLVAEHQAVLRTFVRMLGIHPMWVDDVSQEVFLIAYRNFAAYDPEREFLTWLRGIARNVVANERRKEGRRSRLIRRDVAELLARAIDDTQPSSMSLRETHTALRLCIDDLPAHSRELVRLRYEEDLDSDAMGADLGRAGNAVRQALFRVREVLRRCVEGRIGKEAWP